MNPPSPRPILELRVALTAESFERSLRFYTEGLGLQPDAIWENDGGNGIMLDLGRGTLELFDERQAEVIDQLEVGQRVSGAIRFALQVPDLDEAIARLLAHGATLVHAPVTTPWGDRNARVTDPDGLQVTLFEAAEGA